MIRLEVSRQEAGALVAVLETALVALEENDPEAVALANLCDYIQGAMEER